MDELLASRTKLRSKATKLCNDLRSYREGDRKALDPDQLALKLHHLKKLQSEMQGIQVQLDKMGQADDTNHLQNTEDEVFLGSRLLTRLERAEEAEGKAECHIPTAYTELKTALSLKIPTFQGDVMKWAEFWELFVIAVHDNPKFAKVQKFVVLKSHLAGSALKSIQGIPVTADGYTQAVEALKERFDLDDLRRETMLKDLLNMPSVRPNDLKGMRNLIDHLSSHTRALSTLGVSSDSFSSLMLPVVKDKIPESWRLEWARRESNDFTEFLAFLQHEIRIRDSARGRTDPAASSGDSVPMPSVTSNLNAQRTARAEGPRVASKPSTAGCGCCGRGYHRLDQCEKFRELSVEARWKSARALKTCYRCLRTGHLARACRDGSCATCGRWHHSLLHTAPAVPPQVTAQRHGLSPKAPPFSPIQAPVRDVCSDTGARGSSRQGHQRYNARGMCGSENFFQTALVEAEGPGGKRKVRLLIDGASDSSYIRSTLAKELGLSVTGTGTFACIGFQERIEQARQYDQVEVTLRSRFGGDPVTMKMWSTETLCSPLPATSPANVPSGLPEMMADDFEGGEVDLLIGIDHVYRVVLRRQLEMGERLRVIETVFGYVIHGHHGDCAE